MVKLIGSIIKQSLVILHQLYDEWKNPSPMFPVDQEVWWALVRHNKCLKMLSYIYLFSIRESRAMAKNIILIYFSH